MYTKNYEDFYMELVCRNNCKKKYFNMVEIVYKKLEDDSIEVEAMKKGIKENIKGLDKLISDSINRMSDIQGDEGLIYGQKSLFKPRKDSDEIKEELG